ncbi:MAG: hypothetical protein J7J61_00370 [Candidatus Hydrothermae bacterium]|nr:hypothetical protein [Candidatus Hydrothermae bacterium]
MNDTTVKKVFDFFELTPEKSPFEVRSIKGAKNRPRKFIKLKENYMKILLKAWGE